jgi:hypothetical protein
LFRRAADRIDQRSPDRLRGSTRAVIEDWFAVDALTIERWALEHPEFRSALEVKPIGVTLEDCGLFNWLKDYWLGNLAW